MFLFSVNGKDRVVGVSTMQTGMIVPDAGSTTNPYYSLTLSPCQGKTNIKTLYHIRVSQNLYMRLVILYIRWLLIAAKFVMHEVLIKGGETCLWQAPVANHVARDAAEAGQRSV